LNLNVNLNMNPDGNGFNAFDIACMREALLLARRGEAAGEVPVGAVLVREGGIIAKGFNCPIGLNDPTAHAEICAIRAAAQNLNNYRLTGTVLYVTLEPCLMCAGAIQQARIARVIYAAADVRWGARHLLGTGNSTNHQVIYSGGLLEDEAAQLLKAFFAARR
jgi:tRNA(adenine34) deaminase